MLATQLHTDYHHLQRHHHSGIKDLKCNVKLHSTHAGIWTEIYVIQDIPNQTPWLMGNDFLRNSLGSLSYVDKGWGPEPLLTVSSPERTKCTTYYVAPRVLNICRAY